MSNWPASLSVDSDAFRSSLGLRGTIYSIVGCPSCVSQWFGKTPKGSFKVTHIMFPKKGCDELGCPAFWDTFSYPVYIILIYISHQIQEITMVPRNFWCNPMIQSHPENHRMPSNAQAHQRHHQGAALTFFRGDHWDGSGKNARTWWLRSDSGYWIYWSVVATGMTGRPNTFRVTCNRFVRDLVTLGIQWNLKVTAMGPMKPLCRQSSKNYACRL